MSFLQDVRFAVRLLVKDKWFTLVAAIALSLGIGVNNTVFTAVNAILIRGLPADAPDRIMALNSYDAVRGRDLPVSYLDFRDWRTASTTFGGLAAFNTTTMNVSDGGRLPERFIGSFISANAFELIGQQPVLGRGFRAADDRAGAEAVVLLSHGLWRNRYGSDPSVVGRAIRVNDVPSVVVGVMPDGFKFPQNTDLWQPLALVPDLETQKRNARVFEVFGRLGDGVSLPKARAELVTIGRRLTHDYPDTNKDIQPKVQTFNDRVVSKPGRVLFLALMGAVTFVLLIACANVANLLLARSARRSREISIRVSLGATRWRIVRQLLVESVLLALIAGLLGFALSLVGIRLLDMATQDMGKPYWMDFTIDGHVFAFLTVTCLATGVIFGVAPALHVSKTDVNEVLKEGGRSGSAGMRARRWTGALIITELAMTLVLLAGAGFMMRSFLALYQLDLGIDTSRLLTLRLALPERKYPAADERVAFYERLEERLAANGRLQSAALSSNLPLQIAPTRQLAIEGRPLTAGEHPPAVTTVAITPRYFDTIGSAVVRGRGFTDTDGLPGHENAIINQRLAQMHFTQEDPIGRRIQLTVDPATGAPAADPRAPAWMTIVGIAPSVRQRNFQERDPDPVAYLPLKSDPRVAMALLVRGEGDPGALTPLVREELRAIDPDLPLFGIQTMNERLAQQRWPYEVFGSMFAIFAIIALVLSAVGLYAMTAYAVTQRTQEIGVRMALGAQSTQVIWLFLRRALFHLGVGLTLGIAGAFAVGKLLESLLVQTSTADPVTIVSIVAMLAIVAVAACLWPAHRATRLDPLNALRYD